MGLRCFKTADARYGDVHRHCSPLTRSAMTSPMHIPASEPSERSVVPAAPANVDMQQVWRTLVRFPEDDASTFPGNMTTLSAFSAPGIGCLVCGENVTYTHESDVKAFDIGLPGLWKCAQCPDVDLCGRCAAACAHTQEHCFLHLSSPPSSPLDGIIFTDTPTVSSWHMSATASSPTIGAHREKCDLCDVRIVGARFMCATCANYDLCETCYIANSTTLHVHSTAHVFVRIPAACASTHTFPITTPVSGSRLPSRLLALLTPTPASSAVACVGADAAAGSASRTLTTATYSDVPHIAALERACFGERAWNERYILSNLDPVNHRFMDVLRAAVQPPRNGDLPATERDPPLEAPLPCPSPGTIPPSTSPTPQLASTTASTPPPCTPTPALSSVCDNVQGTTPSPSAGYVAYRMQHGHSGERPQCYITSVAVHPRCRGRGLGSELVMHVLSTARARGCGVASLHVAVDNAGAIKLYERHGFIAERLVRGYYPPTPTSSGDAFVMVCFLR